MSLLQSLFGTNVEKPRGILLSGKNAEKKIKAWEKQHKSVLKEGDRIEKFKPIVKSRIEEINGILSKELTRFQQLKKKYTSVKRVSTKKKYAMLLVNSQKLIDYLNVSKSLMETNLERAINAIEQSKALGRLLYEQIKDAKIFYEMNGQIRLVGEALAFADSMQKKTDIFVSQLEVNIENLENVVIEESGEDVLERADEIINGGSENEN